MKTIHITLFLFFIALTGYGQTSFQAEQKFHEASNLYINKNFDQALASVKEGLKIQPNSEKLEALRKILEQEKKQQEQQKDKQKKEQEKKDQKDKDQQEGDQKEKDGEKTKDNKDSENKKEEDKDQDNNEQDKDADKDEKDAQEQKDQEKKNQKPDSSPNPEQMKISEEKARMILEAMRNQEIQYLQQQKRKATQPRDRNKPDW